jgi:predicted nucleic acid-binding protein
MIATPVACVVDASVAIKLVFTEPLSTEAHALFAHLANDPAARFVVPELFYVECANVLGKNVQRSGYPLADAQLSLATLNALALERFTIPSLPADALAIAANHRITVYDACYVATANHTGLSLVTADSKLVRRMAGTPYRVLDLGGLTIPPPPP